MRKKEPPAGGSFFAHIAGCVYLSLFIQNRWIPSDALKPVAANTLKRSPTPNYEAGTIFIPIAPTSIMANATAAHTP